MTRSARAKAGFHPATPQADPDQPFDLENALQAFNEVTVGLHRLNLEARGQINSAMELIVRGVQQAFPGYQCTILRGAPEPPAELKHPLRWRGNGEGWLFLEPALPGPGETATILAPMSHSETLLVEAFAQQASGVLGQAQQLHEVGLGLARKERELTRLGRAGLLISSRRSLEETLKAILQMALEVTGARYGILRLLERSRHMLVTAAVAGKGLLRPQTEELDVASCSITGWVATHRQSICIADLDQQPWKGLYYPLDSSLEMRSELAAPLLGAGGLLEGVLNLESPHRGHFQDEDRILLQALANQAVIALQQVRLLDALQQLAEVSLLEDCQRLLQRLTELAQQLLNAERVWILTEQGGKVVCRASVGVHPVEGNSGEGMPPIELELVDSTRVGVYGHNHRVEVPVVQPGGVRGLLGIESESQGAAEWETKVLTCLAHHAGLALQSEQREAELHVTQEQRALAETFAALGDLTANLLHQLNNKVGVIPVRIEGIRDRCQESLSGDPYLDRNLKEVERNAQEALRVVRESFQLLDPKSVGPTRVERCVKLASEDLKFTVHTEGLVGLPPVVGGLPGVRLIFWNLFDNAKRILRSAGLPEEVSVSGRLVDDKVIVEVSDHGPGVDPQVRPRIFDMTVMNSSGRGLGFGLWWVRCLMVRLGGTVELASGHPGACFRLTFPRSS